MRVLFLTIVICTLIVGAAYLIKSSHKNTPVKKATSQPTIVTPTATHVQQSSSIFIPYWNIPSEPLQTYDELVYFGISATTEGVNTTDQGYTNLEQFTSIAGNRPTYLTLRLLDTDVNLKILQDKKVQQQIIIDTVKIAEDNGFKGVVIDLEMGALPFTDLISSINTFIYNMTNALHEQHLLAYQTMYGDVFYRLRPYDVQTLEKYVDGIYIMAYDLHKVRGEPGPNFPLSGREKFGYDFETMINDFIARVPAEKLTVIFGMYGYDWVTDYKKNPIEPATAISLDKIKSTYMSGCTKENCVMLRNEQAQEMEISYVDSKGPSAVYHDIWYEDEVSVAKKQEYMQKKGIGKSSYWVYGYF